MTLCNIACDSEMVYAVLLKLKLKVYISVLIDSFQIH